MAQNQPAREPHKLTPLNRLIFSSRWLQLPLYLGLILAQCVYVFHFWVELKDLIGAATVSYTHLTLPTIPLV